MSVTLLDIELADVDQFDNPVVEGLLFLLRLLDQTGEQLVRKLHCELGMILVALEALGIFDVHFILLWIGREGRAGRLREFSRPPRTPSAFSRLRLEAFV